MQYSVTWWHVTGRAASWCLHVYDSDAKVKSLQPSFLCVAWPGHAPAPSGYSKSSHMSNVLITSSLGSFMFRWWRQQWHLSFSSLKWQCVPIHPDCVFMSLYLGRMVNIRSAVWFCFVLWKSFRTREISLYMVFYFESSPASLIYYSAKLPPLMSSASHWTIGLGIFTDSESQVASLSLPKSAAYFLNRGKLPRGSVYNLTLKEFQKSWEEVKLNRKHESQRLQNKTGNERTTAKTRFSDK